MASTRESPPHARTLPPFLPCTAAPMGRAFLRRRSSPPPPPLPGLEAIESSLRKCFLSDRPRSHRRSLLPDDPSDIAVELNSHIPLPYLWEQVLNLKTGEIYYVNRDTGVNTTNDPRIPRVQQESDCCSSSGSYCSGDESSTESSESSAMFGENEEVLLLVGCRVCFTLSMVARTGNDCPKCASHKLLHF